MGAVAACSGGVDCPAQLSGTVQNLLPVANGLDNLSNDPAGTAAAVANITNNLDVVCNNQCMLSSVSNASYIARVAETIGTMSGYTADAVDEAAIDAATSSAYKETANIFRLMCSKDPSDNQYCSAKIATGIVAVTSINENSDMVAYIQSIGNVLCSYCGNQFFALSPVINSLNDSLPIPATGGGNDTVNQFFPLMCSTAPSGLSCAATLVSFQSDQNFMAGLMSTYMTCATAIQPGGVCTAACRNAVQGLMNSMGCCFRAFAESMASDIEGANINIFGNIMNSCSLSSPTCQSSSTGVISLRIPNLKYSWVTASLGLTQTIKDAIIADLAQATGTGAEFFEVMSLASGSLIVNVGVRGTNNRITRSTFDAANSAAKTGALAFPNVAQAVVNTGDSASNYATDPSVPLAAMFVADQTYANVNGTVEIPNIGDGASALTVAAAAIMAIVGAFFTLAF